MNALVVLALLVVAADPPADAPPADAPPIDEAPAPEAAAPDAAPSAKPAPDPTRPAEERNDYGLLVPVAQFCGGTLVAWIPIPCVTSAASGYVVTAAGNSMSPRDNAAAGPMIAAVITDVVVIGLIAGGYGVAYLGASSGSAQGALAGLLGGVVLIFGGFFARPFAVAAVSTITWQLQAEERGGDAWLPPPLFAPDPDEASAAK